MPPLVSCVMVTGKTLQHEKLARLSLRDFLLQTHTPRELIVVNDGQYRLLPPGRDYLTSGDPVQSSDGQLPCPSQTLIYEPVLHPVGNNQHASLGELRNIGLDHAKGDFVCQWDDDDHHHPSRVKMQLDLLQASGKEICCLTHQVRYSIPTNSAFVARNTDPGIVGTVLHRKTTRRYPLLGKHEDSHFFKAYPLQERLLIPNSPATFPGPACYVRMFHGHNTFGQKHIMSGAWTWQDRWDLPTESLRNYLQGIVHQYKQAVS
jgi:glycosyltransferase involved in cell wall biosynthesis